MGKSSGLVECMTLYLCFNYRRSFFLSNRQELYIHTDLGCDFVQFKMCIISV
jgi:hypothetical protein